MFLQAIIDDLVAEGIGVFNADPAGSDYPLYGSVYPPDAPDTCMVLRLGNPPEPSQDLPIEFQVLQVINRGLNFPAVEAKSRQVFKRYSASVSGNKWQAKHNYLIGSYYVLTSKALQPPSDISPDEKGRSEVSFNIVFRLRVQS